MLIRRSFLSKGLTKSPATVLVTSILLMLSQVSHAATVTLYTDYAAWQAASANSNLQESTFDTNYSNISKEASVGSFAALPSTNDPSYMSTRTDSSFSGNNVNLGRSATFNSANTGFQNSFEISAYQSASSGDATIVYNDIPAGKSNNQIDAMTDVLSIGKFNGYSAGQGNTFDFDKDDFTFEITSGPAIYGLGFDLINNKYDVSEWLEIFATKSDTGTAAFDSSDGQSLALFDNGLIPGYTGSYEDNFDDNRFLGVISDTPFSWLEFHEDSYVNDIGIANFRFASQASNVVYTTTKISLDGVSQAPQISANDRYVVFQSDAENLVSNDTNGHQDVFVFDRTTQTTSLISLSSAGAHANNKSESPDISGDGEFIVFASDASNLDGSDAVQKKDIFIHQQSSATTTKISIAHDGTEANGDSKNPTISADGRYVAFESTASNLVTNDVNGSSDIFLYDSNADQIKILSDNGDGDSLSPEISADGRYVVFASSSTNLVTGLTDNNLVNDIFVYEISSGVTTIVSVDSLGNLANEDSFRPAISGDGRYVVFDSLASNLVTADTNNFSDVFVYDRIQNETTRVSLDQFSAELSGPSLNAVISGNGRLVTFESAADDIVGEDLNNAVDIFVRDRVYAMTDRISVMSYSGNEADQDSHQAAITLNGRHIAFSSQATDLVEDDENGKADVFLSHDSTLSDDQYLLVTSKGTGSGGFSISPAGTDCGDNSTSCGYYSTNTIVTVSAMPTSGDQFVAWSGCQSTSGTMCTVTMDGYKSVIAEFKLNESGTNAAPILNSPGDQTNTEGESVALSISASDLDGDTLSYSASNLPSGLSINSVTGVISGTITLGNVGSQTVTITVNDGQLETSVMIEWTVTASVDDIIIDNGASNTSFTGSWSSSGNSPPYGQNSLFASNTATYRWTPNVITAGDYKVYAWWTAHWNRSASAPYTTAFNGGTDTATVDQSTSGSGGGKWVLLGTYSFAAGSGGYIELTGRYDNGRSFSADAIKLEYVGGGTSNPPTNSAPVVTINGPSNSVVGDAISLTATVTDEDSNLASSVNWSSDLDGALGSGATLTTSSLSIGHHSMTASVTDSDGASGNSSHTITVTATNTNVEDIIIDNGASNTSYTGDWSSSGNSPPYGQNSLFAKNIATYRWTPNVITAGDYKVYAWWTAHWNRSASAPYTTTFNGGTDTATVDQSTSGSGGGKWVLLGTYSFAAGSGGYIELTGRYDNGRSFSADAIKLEYVGGGTSNPPTNSAPVVTINGPSNSVVGDAISLTATVTDEDSNLASSVNWSSDLDGALGSGATLTTSSLSIGHHSMTASVTDSDGASGNSSHTITVTATNTNVEDIIIDNGASNTSYTGDWSSSGNSPPYGQNSLFALNTATYRWTPSVSTAGTYKVYAWWTAHWNRSASAPYTTAFNGGTDTATVDQSTSGSGGGKWVLLGTYSFAAGSGGYIELTGRYDNGRSFSADAIKLEYVSSP